MWYAAEYAKLAAKDADPSGRLAQLLGEARAEQEAHYRKTGQLKPIDYGSLAERAEGSGEGVSARIMRELDEPRRHQEIIAQVNAQVGRAWHPRDEPGPGWEAMCDGRERLWLASGTKVKVVKARAGEHDTGLRHGRIAVTLPLAQIEPLDGRLRGQSLYVWTGSLGKSP
jgi:hypothetical protein